MNRVVPLLFLCACGGLTPAGGVPVPCDPATDPTCQTGGGTTPVGGEKCNDGLDNDNDGDTDCADAECVDAPSCDGDGDGYADQAKGGADCDDTDPLIFPGAPEICDSVDNNCEGTVDEDDDADTFDACEDCDNQDPYVSPAAADACDDGIDSNCDGYDCVDWIDDFETGVLGAGWSLGGTTGMQISNTSYSGAFGASNADIIDSQSSCMSVNLTYAAYGTISFWHSGDTESCCDDLRFYIDGSEPTGGSWAGNWAWQWNSFPVNAGVHTMQWCYEKDISISTGADTVWVDEIVATGGTL